MRAEIEAAADSAAAARIREARHERAVDPDIRRRRRPASRCAGAGPDEVALLTQLGVDRALVRACLRTADACRPRRPASTRSLPRDIAPTARAA